MIRSAADVPDGFTTRTDVCVIGSGAGGGVAAALLAEGGREVFVLEEGPHVPAAKMTQREHEMYPLLYRDGGNQTTDDGGVNVLQGRVMGGSTVVNMADVVGIPDGVLAHWREAFGVARYSVDDVRQAEEACRQAIGANRIAESSLNLNNRHLLRGGRALGLSGGTFVHNRVGCIGSGYCLVGCAYDAKRSVALTWIPRAVSTGRAIVQTEARVDRLEWEPSRVTAAVGHLVRPRDGVALAPFRVEADHFVLAAGAVHTPLLLAASELGGSEVGRNLSLQPQTPVAAVFPDRVTMFRGIPQGACLDGAETATAEEGLGGYRLEAVSGGPAMAAASTSRFGPELHEMMRSFDHLASCLCLVPDKPVGRVRRSRNGRPKISYAITPEVEQTLVSAVRVAAEVYLEAGAREVFPPFPDVSSVRSKADLRGLDGKRVLPAVVPLISAHPQGTARMGKDPSRSVVGEDLRLHGFPNLQILDASVFPTSASSHTMLPVMAFAWLGARELL